LNNDLKASPEWFLYSDFDDNFDCEIHYPEYDITDATGTDKVILTTDGFRPDYD